jgi:ribonuclease HI
MAGPEGADDTAATSSPAVEPLPAAPSSGEVEAGERTRVYTDGACSGNPGPGGWAWLVPDGPFAAGAAAETTNQRMELTAALEALRALDGPLEVLSDSTYVVNCFRDRWWEGWLRRGWLNSQKKPVANRDLWEPLIELARQRNVQWTWVKGHGTDAWNDLADRLAVEAATTQAARSGSEPPGAVGPPDATRRPRLQEGPPRDPTGREPPSGRVLLVVGQRSRDEHAAEIGTEVRRQLREILAAKATMHEDLVVVSGLRLGAELLGAEAALAAGVPLVAVLPYPDPARTWPAAARRRFDELSAAAAEVITLQAKVPDSVQSARGALARRDAWFARNASEAIVVWDGEDDDVGRTVRSLQDALGEEDVWVLAT